MAWTLQRIGSYCLIPALLCGWSVAARAQSSAPKTTRKSAVQPAGGTRAQRVEESAPPVRPSRSASIAGAEEARPNPLPAGRATVGPVRDLPADDEADETIRRPVRPPAQPLRVEKLDPVLEQALKEWEIESAKIKKLSGEFTRWHYNAVFATAKLGKGQFYYESPDKGRLEVRGIKPVKPVAVKAGINFNVQPDTPDLWLCTGTKIMQIHEDDRTYEELEIPEQDRGENIMDTPLPFLFGMKAEKAKRRYELKLDKRSNDDCLFIHVRPRMQSDAANYREAMIKLDRKLFLPQGVQLIGPDGGESVYVFDIKEYKINPRNWLQNPMAVNLKGFQRVMQAGPPPTPAQRSSPKYAIEPQGAQEQPKPPARPPARIPTLPSKTKTAAGTGQ